MCYFYKILDVRIPIFQLRFDINLNSIKLIFVLIEIHLFVMLQKRRLLLIQILYDTWLGKLKELLTHLFINLSPNDCCWHKILVISVKLRLSLTESTFKQSLSLYVLYLDKHFTDYKRCRNLTFSNNNCQLYYRLLNWCLLFSWQTLMHDWSRKHT